MQHRCIKGRTIESNDRILMMRKQQSNRRETAPPTDLAPASYARAKYLHESEYKQSL